MPYKGWPLPSKPRVWGRFGESWQPRFRVRRTAVLFSSFRDGGVATCELLRLGIGTGILGKSCGEDVWRNTVELLLGAVPRVAIAQLEVTTVAFLNIALIVTSGTIDECFFMQH